MIDTVYFDLNIKVRAQLIFGYLTGAPEGLSERLANIKASGRGDVAFRITCDVITYVEQLHQSVEETRP